MGPKENKTRVNEISIISQTEMSNADEEYESKKTTPIRLPGTQVTLRSWQLKDRRSLIENANNYRVCINLRDHFPYPYTDKDAAEWLDSATTLSLHRSIHLAIEVEDKAVGGISIEFGEDVHRCTAELGYWLGEPYWSRGIMSEAVKLIRDYVFTSYPQLQRLYASPFSTNAGSVKVLEKAQFEFEGRLRKSVINRDGKVLDQLMYAVVRE